MPTYRNIVVLTGAGLSAESGIATFRDRDGIWAKVDVEDVATPEAFRRNPQLVHDFYNHRRRGHAECRSRTRRTSPWRSWSASTAATVTIVTQNIDALHEAAGSHNLIHMHGELLKALMRAVRRAARVERRSRA